MKLFSISPAGREGAAGTRPPLATLAPLLVFGLLLILSLSTLLGEYSLIEPAVRLADLARKHSGLNQPEILLEDYDSPDLLVAQWAGGWLQHAMQLGSGTDRRERSLLERKLTPSAEAIVRPRLEVEKWLENVASFEEVEAVKRLKDLLEENKDIVQTEERVFGQTTLGWMNCALEGGQCSCESGQTRFGDSGTNSWIEMTGSAELLCEASFFGNVDPSPGAVKTCQCKKDLALCPDGQPVNADLCPGSGEVACRAGCARARMELLQEPRPREQLCQNNEATELLWSCEQQNQRLPPGHPDAEAEEVFLKATESMCGEEPWRKDMQVFLDCDFVQQFLHWTRPSGWFDEAYVTYVAGGKGSKYERQATNVVRSVQLFSSRPIVVTTFGDFVAPASWKNLPGVVVLRLHPISEQGVSFNFNKIRALILSRVRTGVQLDTDQIIYKGCDQMFAATKREIDDHYPWPMLPIHWMARDDVPNNPYQPYVFTAWRGEHTMRWGHAHPTFTFFALPFLCDLLHERYLGQRARWSSGTEFEAWNLPAASSSGLLQILRSSGKVNRTSQYSEWFSEDEDMLNVNLWRDGAKKDWCKFDLEPDLFLLGTEMEQDLYWDPKWYPDGLPVMFFSAHNTKNFEATDWLLKMLELCDNDGEGLTLNCKDQQWDSTVCHEGSVRERLARKDEAGYASQVCCCFHPRKELPIYWASQWYKQGSDLPERAPAGHQSSRSCRTP